MVFFLHTLIKFHFPCSTDSPEENFPVVSSISNIHLFGTLYRGEEVPCLQEITQNESTTTENCGWRQLEEQKQQVTSTNVLCLAAETKVGMPKWKQVLSEKVLVLPHSWQSLWNYLTGPPTREVTLHNPEQEKRGVEGHRENWQTYFLIRIGPEPSTTSQSSLFGNLETSPSL